AKYKKFSTAEEAKAFVKGKEYSNATSSTASSSNIKKRPIATAVENEDMYDIVYTDGASKDNGKPSAVAGVGVWWGRGDPRNIAERCPGDQTNNRAELIAILRVLEETPVTKKPLLIRTDSRYCMQCLEDWMPNWIRNNWMNSSKEPVKNAGIIRLISAHLDLRGQRGQQIRFDHVKGHSGDVGNDGADYQANQGTLLPPVPDRDWATAEVEVRSRIRMTDIPVSRTISRIEEADGEKSVVIESSPIETPAKRQRVESPQPSIPEQVAKTPAKQSMSKAQSSVKTPLRTPSRDAN
ncbi:ribonuclease H-like protein, partial [Coprinopsis marcescibilis]